MERDGQRDDDMETAPGHDIDRTPNHRVPVRPRRDRVLGRVRSRVRPLPTRQPTPRPERPARRRGGRPGDTAGDQTRQGRRQ